MNKLPLTEVKAGDIPVLIMEPLVSSNGEAVILYHGWSSAAPFQKSKAILLAARGYTVFIPEAVHHGKRGALADYYAVEDYDLFWDTILTNMKEFPIILSLVRERGFTRPFIMGHSMGGLTVMGIGASYPDSIKGIVSLNGSGDWELTHIFMEARYGINIDGHFRHADEVKEKSPLYRIEEMKKTPCLLLNGEKDQSVDHRAQTHFAEQLKKAGGTVKQIIYPRLDHFVTVPMMDDAVTWLDDIISRA